MDKTRAQQVAAPSRPLTTGTKRPRRSPSRQRWTGQRFGSINLRDLNMKETMRINPERGIEFRMPIDCDDRKLPLIAASGCH